MKTIQEDKHIMTLLGVTELSRVIAHTNKGYLTLQLRKNEDKYHLVLDAVPLDKETNKELMDLLFPKIETSIPQVNREAIVSKIDTIVKPRGRPAGSKNGVKNME